MTGNVDGCRLGFLGLDSLYLVVEYPLVDLWQRWSAEVALNDVRLREGIAVDGGLVVRRGGLGYKLSVWDGDARLFLTDRVEDVLKDTSAAGQGMGVMLQLGPRWLRQFGEIWETSRLVGNVLGQLEFFGVSRPEQYRIRVNRADLTVDVVGLNIGEFVIDEWVKGWVGYATQKQFHISPESGLLGGLSVGSSAGAVRFKAYDKLVEAAKRGTTSFWRSVWGLGEDDFSAVTRFEWTVKVYEAQFAGARYLDEFTFARFCDVLNYVARSWGSLRIPQESDENQTRWPYSPLWEFLLKLIDAWFFDYEGRARREYDYSLDVSDSYLRFVAGTLAGLQVRAGLEKMRSSPATLARALAFLAERGYPIEDIEKKASERWAVLSRTLGAASGA